MAGRSQAMQSKIPRSAELSRSPVPNPAINSLLVNFVDLYELISF